MCGIVGVFNLDGNSISMTKLVEMGSQLDHRGPDGEGFYLKENIQKIFSHCSTIFTFSLLNMLVYVFFVICCWHYQASWRRKIWKLLFTLSNSWHLFRDNTCKYYDIHQTKHDPRKEYESGSCKLSLLRFLLLKTVFCRIYWEIKVL